MIKPIPMIAELIDERAGKELSGRAILSEKATGLKHRKESIERTPWDPGSCRQLLKAAPWPVGKDGEKVKTLGQRFHSRVSEREIYRLRIQLTLTKPGEGVKPN